MHWTRRNFLQFSATAAAGLSAATLIGNQALAAKTGAKGKHVEYIAFGLQFEYQVALVGGIKKRAADAGIDINVIDGKGDPNLQVTQVLNAVSKQPDALLLNPVDATLLIAGVQQANRAGIPVFILENAPPKGKYAGFVDFDNKGGGIMGANALADFVGKKGAVLETRGSVGSEEAQARHAGFNETMASKYPDIKVQSLNTEWVADKAYKMVLDAFTQNPDVKGIFSHNDEMVRGIVSALKQIGRLVPEGKDGHVYIVGLDGTPLALERIRKGTQDASVAQNPYEMGRDDIMGMMIDYFEGNEYDDNKRVEPYLITKKNAENPDNWGNRVK